MRALVVVILMAATLAVLSAACSSGTDALPATGTAGPQVPSPALVPRPASTVAANLPGDFRIDAYKGAEVLGGSQVQLSAVVAQGKPVALNFFGGLCPPCRAEMPDLQTVYERLGDRFVLIGVDLGPFTGLGNNSDGRALANELGLTFPTGSTSDARIVGIYRVLGIPSTLFLTPDGKVLRKWDGPLSTNKMQELVEQLIAASAS
jgi:thiol-disulfide isomerase/thioredoxin